MDREGIVLLISNDFPPISGGQSRYLYDLWSCLPAEQIVVMAPQVKGSESVDAQLPYRVERVPLRLYGGRLNKVFKALQLLRAAFFYCRCHRVRAIHCGQVFSTGFAGRGCRALLGIPYVVYVYGADVLEFCARPLWGRALRTILQGAERVVAISGFSRRAALRCGAVESRLEVVKPALDVARFAAEFDRDRARARFGWQGRRVVLSVGRLVERKGQDTVLRALVDVAGSVPEVLYAIGGSGPYGDRLQAMVDELGLRAHVEFLGFVDEGQLAERYAAADVFAMVSREIAEVGEVEGFGIVYLEANACGTPVVAGRSGGVEDAVVDGETGLLVDPDDPAQTAAALRSLLADEALRRHLGAQGRRRVLADFDRRQQARNLWALSP